MAGGRCLVILRPFRKSNNYSVGFLPRRLPQTSSTVNPPQRKEWRRRLYVQKILRFDIRERASSTMAMVTDFLIGFLLLLSATINILALSAFLITPSLRTTSNRFVINLLIVNVIGCIILAPSLLFNSNVIRSLYSTEDAVLSVSDNTPIMTTTAASPALTSQMYNKSFYWTKLPPVAEAPSNFMTVSGLADNTSTNYKVDTHPQIRIETTKATVQATTTTTTMTTEEGETNYHRMRPWILDLIAAIGALSLVLVVGDTYVGVTDPLRYHSRVSASRVCILIIIVWCSALGFGFTSAFRFDSTIPEQDNQFQHTLYNTAFKCAYFACIILIPFSLVCAMYWGIIREARKNGLRLRHNGSSPLLQSVLNIGHGAHQRDALKDSGVIYPCDCCRPEVTSIKSQRDKYSGHRLGVEGSSLRRNKSMQYLACTSCGCGDRILITRSISNQSAYLSGAQHLRVPTRDLRTARSTPDLHQHLLPDQGAALEHIRLPRRPTKSLGYMTSIRHRLSNASSLFKYREESRAARISILVVIMFLISYIPFGLLVLTEGHDSLLSTYQQTVLAIFFVVLANIISPLIFAYRNKRVRRGIKRLVSSVPAGCANNREQRKGDNNNSIKELSERNNHNHPHHTENSNSLGGSPRTIKLIRHTSVDVTRNGTGLSLLHDNAISLLPPPPPPPPESVKRRKLVIFRNGRNGQITKVCHPDHHKQQQQSLPTQWEIKGCNKDKLLCHKNSCCWTRAEGCQAHTLKVATSRTKYFKSTKDGPVAVSLQQHKELVEAEPFLRRFRNAPGQVLKKSHRTMVPQVNVDYPSKPIDV